jgi:glutamine synthetase
MYYCSVGGKNTHGRALVEEHADLCIAAGINFGESIKKLLVANGNFNCLHKEQKKVGRNLGSAIY